MRTNVRQHLSASLLAAGPCMHSHICYFYTPTWKILDTRCLIWVHTDGKLFQGVCDYMSTAKCCVEKNRSAKNVTSKMAAIVTHS